MFVTFLWVEKCIKIKCELIEFYLFLFCLRFNNETKNYKVYYDGAFYVGEKRFDNINDLVHDGLISFYIEKHASNYIAMMAEESNYAESPYVASRTALLARQKRGAEEAAAAPASATSHSAAALLHAQHSGPHLHHQPQSTPELLVLPQHQQQPHQRISPPSIHANFQRQHQQQLPQQSVTQFYPVQQQQQFHHHVFQPHLLPHSSTSTLTNYQGRYDDNF